MLCAAAFCAGFVDAVAGGGGLIQLPAMLLLLPSWPIATLFGTNKAASTFGTVVAVSQYARRVEIRWRTVLPAATASFLMSILGARVVTLLPRDAIRPIVLGLLVVVAGYTFVRKDFGKLHAPHRTPDTERWLAVLVGAAFGFYDGFFGPGVGSFGIFAFVGLLGFDFLAASAAIKVLNAGSNLSAFAFFAATGHVRFDYAAPMAVCQIAGSVLGARTAVRRGVGFVRPLFLVMASALIARFAWDLLRGP